MPPAEKISSLQNPRVKRLVKLRDRRTRDEAGEFLIEGFREITRALDRDIRLEELCFAPEWFLGANEPALIERAAAAGARLLEFSKDAFAKIAYRERPDGLLAVALQWKRTLEDLGAVLDESDAAAFLLVAEAIEKPGNLGTLLRGADAAGCHGVVVCDPVTDLFNPNVVRASTGVLFSVPCVVAEGREVLGWLRGRAIRVAVTTPAAGAVYSDADLRGPLAIVMGSEQYGLSEAFLRSADLAIRIPMRGQADSLNVAMAAIVALFEAARQRARPHPFKT